MAAQKFPSQSFLECSSILLRGGSGSLNGLDADDVTGFSQLSCFFSIFFLIFHNETDQPPSNTRHGQHPTPDIIIRQGTGQASRLGLAGWVTVNAAFSSSEKQPTDTCKGLTAD